MREASFEIAQELYQLTAWEGVAEWFDDRAITGDNYPFYSLGYLVRKLRELWPGATNTELFGAVAEYMDANGYDFEDAAALLCVQLLKQRVLVVVR